MHWSELLQLRAKARFPRDATGARTFRTGDYGKLTRDGVVTFLGRRDAQVKIQGYRVDLTEVASALWLGAQALNAPADQQA